MGVRAQVPVPSTTRMRCPDWVPGPARSRLRAALRGQPTHATDAIDDLTELVREWDDATRLLLLERFLLHAEGGVPLPAAIILCLSDLLDRDA